MARRRVRPGSYRLMLSDADGSVTLEWRGRPTDELKAMVARWLDACGTPGAGTVGGFGGNETAPELDSSRSAELDSARSVLAGEGRPAPASD